MTYGTARLGTPGRDLPDQQASPPTRGGIWIMQADGSSALQLTDGTGAHFGSVWSPDGRVYFTSLQNGSENVWSVKPLPLQTTEVSTATEDGSASPAAPETPAAGSEGSGARGG